MAGDESAEAFEISLRHEVVEDIDHHEARNLAQNPARQRSLHLHRGVLCTPSIWVRHVVPLTHRA
jgi:hypothetical protein